MNKKLPVILTVAFIGLGMSMPSCPGQQAMQQQIDQLTASNADLTKRVQAMDGQVKQLNTTVGQIKDLLKPMTDTITAQKAGMDQLNANIQEIQTKLASSSKGKASGKTSGKKKH